MHVYVGISLVSGMTSYYAQNILCTSLIFFLTVTESSQSKFPSQSYSQEQISCVHTARDSLYQRLLSVVPSHHILRTAS